MPSKGKKPATGASDSEAAPTRERTTLHVATPLLQAVRDAVVFLSGPPVGLTLVRFVDEAFRRELKRLQDKHHRGKPFPERKHEPRRGRPIGS